MFISIDGIDGAGKTTQIDLLCEHLAEQGVSVSRFRDPGSTKLGESVREILLHREDIPLASISEMLLYMAARAQLVDEQILPALKAGQTVVCDRYLLANIVYQGVAGGLDVDAIWQVGAIATQNLRPERTVLLDLPPEVAFGRLQRSQDRLEKRGLEYFRKVRQGFLEQVGGLQSKHLIVDATQSVETIHEKIVSFLSQKD